MEITDEYTDKNNICEKCNMRHHCLPYLKWNEYRTNCRDFIEDMELRENIGFN